MNHSTIFNDEIIGSRKRIKIFNTLIDSLNYRETVNLVDQYIRNDRPLHLMGVNADKINQIAKDEYLRNIVNSCGIINADGFSVVWASKYLNKMLPERIAGIDLMQKLVALSAEKNYNIFLLGAKPEIVSKTALTLKAQYPSLNIVGIHDGYFAKDEWENIACEIQNSKADIVFVGISSPTKEFIIEYFQEYGLTNVFMGVGGSFDVISGKISRAPKWVQKINMEWFYRMVKEPKRLFKRYLVGNFQFAIKMFKEKIREGNS